MSLVPYVSTVAPVFGRADRERLEDVFIDLETAAHRVGASIRFLAGFKDLAGDGEFLVECRDLRQQMQAAVDALTFLGVTS